MTTAALASYSHRIYVFNNIFYIPDTGLIAYFQYADYMEVFNNVFWGLRQGKRNLQATANTFRKLRRTGGWTEHDKPSFVQQYLPLDQHEALGLRL